MIDNNIRLNRELKTVKKMINIYCQGKHKMGGICNNCTNLVHYVAFKLSKCPFAKNKPVCEDCTIHCYNTNSRDKIKKVMRYSGPRLIFYHPLDVIRHYYQKYFYEK